MTPLIVARAAHYLAIAQLCGGLVFAVLIAPPAVVDDLGTAFMRWLGSLLRVGAVLALLSWIAWLVFVSAEITGSPATALEPQALVRVISATTFGHLWIWRTALLIVVVALLGSVTTLAGARTRVCAATIVACVATMSLAGAGHAAAQVGSTKVTAIAMDALHLLAAGAWLGALLPFAFALFVLASTPPAHVLSRRFSWVGVAAVVVIAASGLWNSIELVGSWAGLLGTTYGHWLLLKLTLVASMLMLAIANRQTTPALMASDNRATSARQRIAQRATIEAALGAGVLATVAVLGVSMPAAHDQPIWPFSFRLDFHDGSPPVVRAYPTTYAHPAVPYSVIAVAQGLALYERHCVACHGSHGDGNGPAAASLSPKPDDLTAAHVLAHTPGDLYWWISHGIEGTAMRSFAGTLDEKGRWQLVHLVRTLADAHLLGHSPTSVAVPAPAFTYQLDDAPQASVPQTNAPAATLIVLYALPDSSRRLSELAQAAPRMLHEGVRVVALPLDGTVPSTVDSGAHTILATTSPETITAYSLLGEMAHGEMLHVEFLVDRDGWVRARWTAPVTVSADELLHLVHSMRRVATQPEMAAHAHHPGATP